MLVQFFVYTQINVKKVLFHTIQFNVSSFNVRTVLFQTIQFSIQKQFHYKQFSLVQARRFLMSYHGHLLGESYPSAEMNSVYSAAPTDLATFLNESKLFFCTQLLLLFLHSLKVSSIAI